MNNSKKISIEYVIGSLYAILGFGLIVLALYLLPYLFNYNYTVPQFVTNFRADLEMHYGLKNSVHMLIMIMPMLILGLFFLYLARIITKKYDVKQARFDDTLLLETTKEPTASVNPEGKRYKIHPAIFHIILILLALSLLLFIEWILSFWY